MISHGRHCLQKLNAISHGELEAAMEMSVHQRVWRSIEVASSPACAKLEWLSLKNWHWRWSVFTFFCIGLVGGDVDLGADRIT